MNRLLLVALLLILSVMPVCAAPPEKTASGNEAPAKNAEDTTLDADSREGLIKFVNGRLKAIVPIMDSRPDEAEQLTASLQAALDSATTKSEDGKQNLAEAKEVITLLKRRIEVSRLSLEDLKKALLEKPNDPAALAKYGLKIQVLVNTVVDEEPDKAVELIESARKVYANLYDKADDEDVKDGLARQQKSLVNFDRSIEKARRLAKLVGTQAVPLEIDAWVNGPEISDRDLKGKVVLLDFWAIWCGPCIGTFPHLRELQEKYSEKGLVIIGVTNYYGFDWDDDEGRPVRSPQTTEKQEAKMLAKFAKHYKLEHRLAIDTRDRLKEHYQVAGIPHVVLIDRQGKVQLVRVGSSEANVHTINTAVEKLIANESIGEKASDKK